MFLIDKERQIITREINIAVSKKMENILLLKLFTVGDQQKILIDICVLQNGMQKKWFGF